MFGTEAQRGKFSPIWALVLPGAMSRRDETSRTEFSWPGGLDFGVSMNNVGAEQE